MLCAGLLASPLRADLSIDFSIADIQGEAFSASGIQLTLIQAADGNARLTGQIEQLSLPALNMTFTRLALNCPQAVIDSVGYVCEQASLSAGKGPTGAQHLTLGLRYSAADDWAINFSGLRLAGGEVNGRFDGGAAGWQGALQAKGLRVKQLTKLRPDWLLPAGWSVDGRLDGNLALDGIGGGIQNVQLSLRGSDVAYADAGGLQAAEGVRLQVNLKAKAVVGEWQGRTSVSLHQGQIYSDPVFVEVGKDAITLDAGFHTHDSLADVTLTETRLHWPAKLDAFADGRLGLAAPSRRHLDITLHAPDLATVYPVLLKPLLVGTGLGDLSTTGAVEARLTLAGSEAERLDMKFDDIHLDDKRGRFGLAGFAGEVHWQLDEGVIPSTLGIESGHLYAVDVGKTRA